MNGFLGTKHQKQDNKGRVSLPVDYRDVLLMQEQSYFYLYPSPNQKWLEGRDPAGIDRLINRTVDAQLLEEVADKRAAKLISSMEKVRIDPANGRFQIPESLREYANITDDVVFIGYGPQFIICNPDEHIKINQYFETADSNI